MPAVRTIIPVVWIVFWVYWLLAAGGAKQSVNNGRAWWRRLVLVIGAIVVLRVFNTGGLAVHMPVLEIVGVVLFLTGLLVAVWARIYLGRNWGMPMSQRAEPELVTTGPYAYVRHPIYSGMLLAILGTALAINLYWLTGLGVIGAYFIYSATVEERTLATTFPTAYPSYRKRTRMLVPHVL